MIQILLFSPGGCRTGIQPCLLCLQSPQSSHSNAVVQQETQITQKAKTFGPEKEKNCYSKGAYVYV